MGQPGWTNLVSLSLRQAQGPSRTCKESKEEEEEEGQSTRRSAGKVVGGVVKVHEKKLVGVPWREAGPPNHHDDEVDADQ